MDRIPSTVVPKLSILYTIAQGSRHLMSIAEDKTKSLIRTSVAVELLEVNELNPNKMGDQEFNLLYDNFERVGLTDPILVRKHPTKEGFYRIIGGAHRYEVAKLHGMSEVPVTVITDPDFDQDQEKFQIVRHNIIRGKMSADKFMNLYQTLEQKYSDEVAAELFGFATQEEFDKLVKATGKSLPVEMQKAFKEAAKEIKTIDDLSLVLNRLFTQYGDSIPYGFMIFDYGSQDHVWLRMKPKQKDHFIELAAICRKHSKSMDGVMSLLLQLIANNSLTQEAFDSGLQELPTIELPASPELPIETASHL